MEVRKAVTWTGVGCAGRDRFDWGPLGPDLRWLVLGKLSVRELARASCTCREFQQAYLHRVAETRAKIIGLGKQMYGEGRFSGLVRVFQRGMRGLDPCPGIPIGEGFGRISAAGEPELLMRDAEHVLGPSMDISIRIIHIGGRPRNVINARARVNLPPNNVANIVSRMSFEVRKTRWGSLDWSVGIGKEAAAAAVGLLLAICTENPEMLTPCFNRPGTMRISICGLSSGPLSLMKREAQEVIGPFGLLAELLTIHPPSHTAVHPPLGEKMQAGSKGVFKSLTVLL